MYSIRQYTPCVISGEKSDNCYIAIVFVMVQFTGVIELRLCVYSALDMMLIRWLGSSVGRALYW